jgi:Tfp pilus assembly PilM family ATPase
VSVGRSELLCCMFAFKLPRISLASVTAPHRGWGWIGIDMSPYHVHLAQLRQVTGSFRLARAWSIDQPNVSTSVEESGETAGDEAARSGLDDFAWLDPVQLAEIGLGPLASQLSQVGQLFRGRQAAVTLSDGWVDYRELELPELEHDELQQILQSEILLESEAEEMELVTALWELQGGRKTPGMLNFGTVAIAASSSRRLAHDLHRLNLECQVLDALPCCQARAVGIGQAEAVSSVLAVDIGYRQVTMTLVRDAQPMMSRCLRQLGLGSALQRVAGSMQIPIRDANTLLFHRLDGDFQHPAAQAGDPLQPLRHRLIQQLGDEVVRTCGYIQRCLPACQPLQIQVMGGGSQLPGLAGALESRSNIPTCIWSIDSDEQVPEQIPLGTLAVACGLSALAWESS